MHIWQSRWEDQMAYERITVVGNIGRLECKVSDKGQPYAKMTLAVNRTKGMPPVWYTVFLFSSYAKDFEKLKAIYRPGRVTLVEGRPQTEAYKTSDGKLAVDNSIVAISMPECLDAAPTR